MNKTNTTMTATATELDPQTMLQHLYTSIRKTQLHLTAYSEETTPEKVTETEVPDYEYYDFNEDRKTTDELLHMSQQILTHLEQHRATYYPGSPAFEDTTTNTTKEGCSRRLHNACEAATWIVATREVSLTYTETLTDNAPAAADARKLTEEVEELLGTIDEHGQENTIGRGVHLAALDGGYEHLEAMNPLYTQLAAERD